MSDEQKPKRGRPTDYNGEITDIAAKALAKQGLTDEEIAEELKIEPSTLYLWKREHPSFSEALRAGKDSVDDRVENALLRRALGYKVSVVQEVAVKQPNGQGEALEAASREIDYPPEPGAMALWLKNRRPDKWREKVDVEHSGSVTILDDVPKKGE